MDLVIHVLVFCSTLCIIPLVPSSITTIDPFIPYLIHFHSSPNRDDCGLLEQLRQTNQLFENMDPSVSTEKTAPLPIQGERNVLVTSALPYVNNYPHLGNIIGAVLSADVYARYLRQRSVNVVYICGTDEYGTATETKAQQENLTPQQICDKYHALHRDVYSWFDISFDIFGRTSTPQQTEIVQSIFWSVYNSQYITQDSIVQLYCEAKCQRFLADRYVHGACPNCGYADARGDQCDSCGKMLDPSDLLQPRCSTCENTPVSRKTTHLFLDLPKIQPKLADWISKSSIEGNWTSNALSMTDTWLRDGLKQRCITRDLKWGVPVPLEGFTDKVFYVWFDAPVGYPSITAALCGSDWTKWWKPAEDTQVDLVQFMGKDNVPFHTIVFPGALLATNEKWTMLHHISTTEYLNYETGKFSKSRGIGVFGNDAIDTGIPPEVWRYYLLLNRPEGSDSIFTWDDLAAKNNDELINTLGNYINRAVNLLYKSFNATIPEFIEGDPEDEQFTAMVNAELRDYNALLDKVSLKAALKKAMAIASIGNSYLQKIAPWKLLKQGQAGRAGSCLAFASNLAVLVAVVFEPYMGTKFSQKVFSQFGLQHSPGVNNLIPDVFDPQAWLTAGMKTRTPEILFSELTPEQVAQFRARYGGKQEEVGAGAENADADDGDAFTLDIRVGKVVQIREHEESDRLFVAEVDAGESETRTVVAGLRDVYTSDELLNRKVAIVCNLVPACLASVDSQGMILVAEKKKIVKTLAVPDSANVGERLVTQGLPVRIGEVPLDRKGFQAASKPLRVGKNGCIIYDKQFLLVPESDPSCSVNSSGVPEGGKVK